MSSFATSAPFSRAAPARSRTEQALPLPSPVRIRVRGFPFSAAHGFTRPRAVHHPHARADARPARAMGQSHAPHASERNARRRDDGSHVTLDVSATGPTPRSPHRARADSEPARARGESRAFGRATKSAAPPCPFPPGRTCPLQTLFLSVPFLSQTLCVIGLISKSSPFPKSVISRLSFGSCPLLPLTLSNPHLSSPSSRPFPSSLLSPPFKVTSLSTTHPLPRLKHIPSPSSPHTTSPDDDVPSRVAGEFSCPQNARPRKLTGDP